jgi:hypothetical protein
MGITKSIYKKRGVSDCDKRRGMIVAYVFPKIVNRLKNNSKYLLSEEQNGFSANNV